MTELEQLARGIENLRPNIEIFKKETAQVLTRALYYTLDDQLSLDYLEGCEKTILGIKVEKYWLKQFNLPIKYPKKYILEKNQMGETIQNPKLDTVIANIDVDIKHSIGESWMIPQECVGEWCVLFNTHFYDFQYSLGLLKMLPENLTIKGNRDTKLSISAAGKKNIYWLARKESLWV